MLYNNKYYNYENVYYDKVDFMTLWVDFKCVVL